jgi:transmembrane sensor
MNKEYILDLLRKYQKGNLTTEERQLLEGYYDLFQNKPDNLADLGSEEKSKWENDLKKNIWKNISKVENPVSKIKFINSAYLKVAAAVFIGIIGSIFLYFSVSSKKSVPENNNAKGVEAKFQKQEKASVVLHQKENRVIFLPDGSTVILSPGSKLNYPSSFDGKKKREVFLDGQAFFDIKHNISRPFIVHTGKLETIVLGTAFNIKAIPGEKDITVTVQRGRVRVRELNKTLGIITPNQQITYDKGKFSSVLSVVSNQSYLKWKTQDLFMDNFTLSEAAKLLEEQYKIDIVINDPSIKELRFTATFPKDEKLEEALKSICLFNGLGYSFDHSKNSVIIYKANKKTTL